jgi:hypothetical protein
LKREVKEVEEVKDVKESEMSWGGCGTENLGGLALTVKARALLSHSKKKNGQRGLPVLRRIVTGALRFEGFLHLGELQLCFGQGLHDEAFGVFRGEVASGGHFADKEILGAL